jgi:two-component system, sensor histidine kinase
MKIKTFARICLLLLLSNAIFYGDAAGSSAAAKAKRGLLDLRQEAFDERVALDGEWEFYWHRLLRPNDGVEKPGVLVEFPFMWGNHVLNGKRLPGFGYASYKLTVLLPKKRKQLRVTMPDAYTAYRLFVNGKQMAANGTVSTTAEGFIPHWQYQAFDIDQNTDTLRLILQIANFVHNKGGIKKPIFIGEKTSMELRRQQSAAIDLVLTGCLFMGGLFFLGLYLLGNRDKAILMFSLYSIVYCYRIIGIDNYVLHSIMPDLDWFFTVRLEYISLFLGVGLFGLYTRYLYPEDVSKKAVVIVSLMCFSFSAASAFLPPAFFTQLINPFLVIMLFCIVYTPYVYLKAYQRKRPGAVYALASSASLMSVFTITLLHYWSVIPQMQGLSFIGYIGFFFLQSLVLSHKVSFELKKARLQAEQGLKTKSEFLSTMSHEIRTPLNSVIGMSHLLLRNDPRPDQVKQLDVMLFSANHLLTIVNDILDYNKIEAGKILFEHIDMDLADIADNVVAGLKADAENKGIALSLEIDPGLHEHVLGDPTRTFQVLSNLVHNAIKFTIKGVVSVSVKIESRTEKHLSLKIAVRDTGVGISEEDQKIIFQRFTQADSSTSRSFGGTGLGLAICKRILELQGGTLHLSSKEGEGSVFYFAQIFERSLNAVKKDTPGVPLPLPKEKPLAGIAILLVEDNPMNVLVAQNFLIAWGATVDVAVNGKEALTTIDVNRHKLVLMDLQMPLMDGYESARTMRTNGVTLPIIALTANLPNEIEADIKQAGLTDVVTKPFLPGELFNKIMRCLSEKSTNV